jgi:uncharacterized repeat protein (TIGR03803 family)
MKQISLALLLVGLLLGSGSEAQATVTFSVIAKLGANSTGFNPNAVVFGSDGNFYGTTSTGGANVLGVVFKLTPSGTLTNLHDFSGGTTDGADPASNLVQTSNGTLYGTTNSGGAYGDGTFFSITTGGTFTILHSFNGATEISAPTLLYLNGDGNFYGIGTFGGGSTEDGALIKLTPSGTYSVVYAFNGTTDGKYPNPQLVLGSDGAYYGTTPEGGANQDGTYFRVTTAGQFSVIGSVASGREPVLTALGTDGDLYGFDDGANTIFKITNSGVQTVVYTFTENTDGGLPNTLIAGTDGNLYGLTTYYGANGTGTFFEITAGGAFSTLAPLPAKSGLSALITGPNSTFYATGSFGGSAGAGEVVQLTKSGTASTIYAFTSPGTYPYAALLQALDGNLYGVTSAGGASDDGTIFAVSTAGEFLTSTSFSFDATGSQPEAPLVQDPTTGLFFGTTKTGGPDYSSGVGLGGAAFSAEVTTSSGGTNGIHTDQEFQGEIMLHAKPPPEMDTFFYLAAGFIEAEDAAAQRYKPGSTSQLRTALAQPLTTSTATLFSVSARGGDNDEGALFAAPVSEEGALQYLYSFGDTARDGSGPETAPIFDSAQNLYGTTAFGGSADDGTIYKITPATATVACTITTLHVFKGTDGAQPGSNNLVFGKDGNIYGTTQAGGAHGAGVVFQMTPAGAYKVLHSFNPNPGSGGADGGSPMAGLLLASDGNLYGTTMVGGDQGGGTVFSITPTGVFTILHSFTGTADGAQPYAGLIQGTEGDLYGITTAGGAVGGVGGSGTIFKIDAGLPPPTTSGTTAQTITFPAIAAQTVGASVTLGATASSGLAVNYTVSGPATLSGSTLTFTALGTVKVTASQPGNSTYAAATPVVQNITVGKGAQTITFPSQADGTYGVPYTITAPTASSGLAVTLKVLSGSAKLSGQTLTFTGTGNVVIAANQAGNASYAAAPQVTATIVVDKGTQTIAAFAAIPTHHENDAAFAVTAPKASSGLPVTITVASGPATISGGKVTLTGTGTVVLAANQAGNADYDAAAQVTTSFSVEAASQTIAPFATIPAKTTTSAPFTITPPKASSGLVVTVTVQSGPATISGDTVTVTGAGTVTLEAAQAGNSDFAAATPVTTTFVVNGAAQTIAAFAKIPAHTFGDAPFAVTPPVASSGLTVVLSVKSGPATISGDTVTLTGAGTVALAADQAGNADFNPAKEVTTSFVVSKAAQTLAPFAAISDKTYGAAPFDVTPPTASSGLATVVTVKSGPAKVTGDLVTLTGVGVVTLSAAQTGNANYNAAVPVTTTFTVAKETQTIAAFPSFGTQMYGSTLTLTAPAASSGLPVTLKVLSGPAKLAGAKLTFTGVGTVVIAANQAGSADVAAAPQVTASITVDPATQTIAAFAPVTARTYGVAPFSVTPPAASSKLTVVLSVLSGPATIAGTKVTLTGAGTVVLAANQAGNDDYDAAAQVTTSFDVAKAAQTIKPFAKITGKTTSSAPFTITLPTASSGLPVSVTVQSGPATLSGNTVTITGSGTVVLAAAQAGNDNYDAATTVTVTFTVP